MTSLDAIRDRAEAYYETPAHGLQVERLAEELRAVTNMDIALGLKGVLTSEQLSRSTFQRPKDDPRSLPFVKRPLADELLKILVANKNKVTIWTTSSRPIAREIEADTRLQIPKGVVTICREDCERKLREASLVSDDRHSQQIRVRLLEGNDHFEQRFSEGMFKDPDLYDVQLLLDDKAEEHREACERKNRPGANRIVGIDGFEPGGVKRLLGLIPVRNIPLNKHHLENGLLGAARILKRHSARRHK